MAKKPVVEKVQVNVRIAKPLIDRLEKLGLPFGLTQTELIRRAVEEYVQNHEQQQPAKHQPRQ